MLPVPVLVAIAAFGAILLTLALRRPRLAATLSLRGGTREGTLYVVIENRGGFAARGVRVRIEWAAGEASARIDERDLGTVAAHDALRIEARDIHLALVGRPEAWTHIRATVRARNALPARGELALQARADARAQPSAPVSYARPARCPDTPDGEHRFERRTLPNDGVDERWEVCRACRFARREPLTSAEEAIQAEVRAARIARERATMEAEWARAERQAHGPRPRRAPVREEPGDIPLAVAYWVLGVAEGATWEEVLAAHRKLAMQHHPDRAHGADPQVRATLEARMQEINRARDRLREHLAEQL